MWLNRHSCHNPLFPGKMQPLNGIALTLLLKAGCVAAQQDGNVCYILDGILIIYGIVLTVLYCRLMMRPATENKSSYAEKQGGGIYEGLGRRDQDTYETLHNKQKKTLS